jgi:CheY-like chemotaxis protein
MSVKLLIIDSDVEHGKTMRDSLKGAFGISEITVAEDGFMAGYLVAQFKPDVMLLDLEMPGVDSSHVCSFIKHDPHTRFIRVIAMCRDCSEQQQKQILDLGAEVCLSTPVSADLLKQVMGLIDPDG